MARSDSPLRRLTQLVCLADCLQALTNLDVFAVEGCITLSGSCERFPDETTSESLSDGPTRSPPLTARQRCHARSGHCGHRRSRHPVGADAPALRAEPHQYLVAG